MVIRHRPIHVHQYTFAAAGGMITENRMVFVNELSEKKMYSYKIEVDSTPQTRVHKIIFDVCLPRVQCSRRSFKLSITAVTAMACGRQNRFRF